LLSFGPEGEAQYGRQNFMELLSAFTSPPLFKVLTGQKELGYVHESTFYNQKEGPPVLVLAGRSWRTQHLDWKRRIAHVEPSEERGRSRWLGEGQFLSYRVCQSVRRVLGGETNEPYWSQRATAQIAELRNEHPWVNHETTSVVRHPSGEIHWWTFGGGAVNALLSEHLQAPTGIRSDNLAIRFPNTCTLEDIEEQLRTLSAEAVVPVPNADAIENLKFSECLPPPIAAEVFCARFNDPAAIRNVLHERRRVFLE
jgi:ATP-dependent Lhr-like helicase